MPRIAPAIGRSLAEVTLIGMFTTSLTPYDIYNGIIHIDLIRQVHFMNIYKGRLWLGALTGWVSLLMGFCEFYTWRIGWHPGSTPWNRASLLQLSDIPKVLVLAVLTFLLLSALMKVLGKVPALAERLEPDGSPLEAPFAFIVVFLLLCWMPFFLVFYPGTGMNDTTDIMRAGIWATGQHTFIYCMYIYGLTQASDMLFHTTSYGLAAASLIQMFLFACGIAYCLSWLYRKTGRMWLTVLLSLYYGFLPMVVNMSFSNVKDVFFSCTILLWVPLVTSFVSGYKENAWRSNKRLFILAGLGMMLLRNNGIYVFIVMLLGLLFLMKRIRMNLLLTGLVMIAISVTPDIAIKQILDLPQLFQERVGIPLQQFSRAVAVGVPLTPEEKAYSVKMMIPGRIEKWYDPFTVDLIKWNSDFDFYYFNSHPDDFWKAWKSVGKRNKEIYVEAWLFATYGYWAFPAPDEMTQSRFCWAFSESDLKNGLSPDHNNAYKTADIHTFFKKDTQEKLGRWLWDHSRYLGAGTCLWITLCVGLLLFYRKQYSRFLVLLPACLLWGTLMIATPAAFVYRYVYFFPLCIPFFLLLPFLPEGKYGETRWAETVVMPRKEITLPEEHREIREDDGYTHWKD